MEPSQSNFKIVTFGWQNSKKFRLLHDCWKKWKNSLLSSDKDFKNRRSTGIRNQFQELKISYTVSFKLKALGGRQQNL